MFTSSLLNCLFLFFKELTIKIPNRVLLDLVEHFTDQYGIDYERMHRLLVKVQANSNQDSAKVKRTQVQCVRESDANMFERLSKAFQTQSKEFFINFDDFKQKLYERCEKHHSIMLSPKEIAKLIEIHKIPLYGSLLNAVFERTNHNNLIKYH